MTSLSYTELETALRTLDSPYAAAEADGLLHGLLTADRETAWQQWLTALLEEENAAANAPVANVLPPAVAKTLQSMFDQTIQQLTDNDLAFTPCLPDDDQSLASRLLALTRWCQGFLYGLGLGGIEQLAGMPDDTQEFIMDVQRIGSVSTQLDEARPEDDELAYAELVEYVRTGVLLLNEERYPEPAPATTTSP